MSILFTEHHLVLMIYGICDPDASIAGLLKVQSGKPERT